MRRITIGLAAAGLAVCAVRGAAQEPERLAIHGYLNQAYAIADGGTLLGIPTTGTTDYRTAALLVRFTPSAADNVTIQLSHRRLGTDIATAGEAPVQLDWAFYGHRFGDFDVRVGRTPIPAGIYNEVRDVGVVLPLYRAPFNFYLEGAFTSETVDGVVGGYSHTMESGWGVDANVFAGGWNMTERNVDGAGNVIFNQSRVERGVGGQVWVRTPMEGVRVGGGASRYTNQAPAILPGTWKEWHASFDGRTSRFTLQSEYRNITTPDIGYKAYYVYAGLRPMAHLTLHGQADFAKLTASPVPQFDFNNDYAIGASWAFRPDLVLKVEGHTADTYWADTPTARIGQDPAAKVKYAIVSIATSF